MLLVPQYNVTTVVHSDEVKIACLYGDELVISSKKKSPKKPRPPWIAIGTGMPNKAFTNYPYEMTLLELTSDEAAMYRLIRQAYDLRTGLSVVNLSAYTPSEKNHYSKGFKGLEKRLLVKKVKHRTYIINPQAIVHFNLYDELWEQWQKL